MQVQFGCALRDVAESADELRMVVSGPKTIDHSFSRSAYSTHHQFSCTENLRRMAVTDTAQCLAREIQSAQATRDHAYRYLHPCVQQASAFLAERYLLVIRPPRRALGGLLHGRASINIAIAETATPEDNIKVRRRAVPLEWATLSGRVGRESAVE